jgi:hypothetical protein
MPRLLLIVEGQTEQAFASQMLAPHLAAKGVFLSKPLKAAHAKEKGRIHRGGILNYEPFRNDIVRLMKEDQNCDMFFSTMIDLYKLPNEFPAYEEANLLTDPYRRVEQLEEALADDLKDKRFIPYIQLHEFESLLLSCPGAFRDHAIYRDKYKRGIENLIALSESFKSPELINDGEETAPSKRIGKEIPDYLSAKPTSGPFIAEKIGLDAIRKKCPHFHRWLAKLENLSSSPAQDSV